MKRIIYLLAISCFLLISCHDDDRFSVENVVGNNTSIVGMWLREAGKEQMVYAFFEDGTGYEKTTDRRNNTVSVDGFTYEFDPNTMSIVFDKEFDNAIYSEWDRGNERKILYDPNTSRDLGRRARLNT